MGENTKMAHLLSVKSPNPHEPQKAYGSGRVTKD